MKGKGRSAAIESFMHAAAVLVALGLVSYGVVWVFLRTKAWHGARESEPPRYLVVSSQEKKSWRTREYKLSDGCVSFRPEKGWPPPAEVLQPSPKGGEQVLVDPNSFVVEEIGEGESFGPVPEGLVAVFSEVGCSGGPCNDNGTLRRVLHPPFADDEKNEVERGATEILSHRVAVKVLLRRPSYDAPLVVCGSFHIEELPDQVKTD